MSVHSQAKQPTVVIIDNACINVLEIAEVIIDGITTFHFSRHMFGTMIFMSNLSQIYQVRGSHGLEKKMQYITE